MLAFTGLMLLKQLLNNLPIFLEGLLNCICTHISIKVNVFIQKNAYHINNYVHKSMENCLFRDNSSLNVDQSNYLANKTVRLLLGLYLQNIIQINSRTKQNWKIVYCFRKNM